MNDRVERAFHLALDRTRTSRDAVIAELRGRSLEEAAELERLLALEDARRAGEGSTGSTTENRTGASGALTWAFALGRGRARQRHRTSTAERVGPYRLVEPIGRGGMGEVYLAERNDGEYLQRVAIKRLRVDLEEAELLHRFRAERQILALLQHPNIARLLDGSVDEDGRPYLVMELVDGEPITVACDQGAMSIEDRLRLFATVCDAVQAAHTCLVVHRDLKPSNVLVDRSGDVKLLDFGVAKLLDTTKTEILDLPQTRLHATPLLTPEYAAPEQVRGQTVTVASDVYALGLLLYEMLCGERAQRLTSSSWQEVEDVVCRASVPPPSSAIAADPDAASRAAARSFSDPRKLARRLRGDLDLIVGKALRKEPERRYESAAALRDDIERHLQHLPVTARPDTLAYRLRKLAERRPGAIAAAVLVVVSLGIAAVTSSIGLLRARVAEQRAQEEAATATQVTEFLVDLFGASDPAQARGTMPDARDLLDMGAEQIQRDEDLAPRVRLALLDSMGRAYLGLGVPDRTLEMQEAALELARSIFGEESNEVGRALVSLGQAAAMSGQYQRSAQLTQQGLDQLVANGATPRELARAAGQLGRAYGQLRDNPAARQALEKALRWTEEDPESASEAWIVRNNLGIVLNALGEHDEAIAVLETALDQVEATHGADHPGALQTLHNLATTHRDRGDVDTALRVNREVLEARQRLLPAAHTATASSFNNVCANLVSLQRFAEAQAYCERALELYGDALGPDHPRLTGSQHNLAEVLQANGNLADAAELYAAELEILKQQPAGWRLRQVDALYGLFSTSRKLARPDEATEFARQALAILDDHPDTGDPWHDGVRVELEALLEGREPPR